MLVWFMDLGWGGVLCELFVVGVVDVFVML